MILIKRNYNNYNSKTIKKGIASATAIRSMIESGKNIHSVVPFESYEVIEKLINNGEYVPGLKVFEKQIIYILRKMPIIDIAALPDVTEGLENRIKAAANSSNNLEELISKIKTKRFTQSRIQRILFL